MKNFSTLLLGMIGITAAVLTTSCNNQSQEEVSPVDLSDVIKIHEWYTSTPESYGRDSMLTEKFMVGYPLNDYENECDTDYGVIRADSVSVDFKQFENSKVPLVKNFGDIYNSCLMVHGITSNMELWARLKNGEPGESVPSDMNDEIKKFDTNVIKDPELRTCISRFKQQVAELTSTEQISHIDKDSLMNNYLDSVYKGIGKKLDEVDKSIHKDKKAVEAYENKVTALKEASNKALDRYNKADSASRLKVILTDLNNCKTLDEQCSLWLAWAQSEKSRNEEQWYNYVAYKILTSGKCSGFTQIMWLVWRAETQMMYYGLSSYSYIPNQFYNNIRKQCFIATLEYIEKHPDDVMTMENAYCFAGEYNLSRFGAFTGNEAIILLAQYLPDHFSQDN